MRCIRILFVAAALAATRAAPAGLPEYQAAVQAEPTLISYFTFDGDAGTTVQDAFATASPNPAGTMVGGATLTAAAQAFGGAGKALSLDGTGRVTFGTVPEFSFGGQTGATATAGTVEMWIRPAMAPGALGYNPALASVRDTAPGGDPNPYTRWSMHLEATRLGWGVFGGIMGYHPEYWDFTPDQWYHVAFVFTPDYTNEAPTFQYPTTRVFVNGILLGDFWGFLGAKTDAAFQIGAATPDGGGAFVGLIDEVAVYAGRASDAALAQHYLAGVGVAPPTAPLPSRAAYAAAVMADGPIGYYPFENDTTSVADASGNGHTGTLVPPTNWTAGFGGGKALALDNSGRSGGMVSMGAVDAFKLAGGAGTVEAWIAPAPGLKYRSDNFGFPFFNFRPTVLSCADNFSSLFHYGLEVRTSDQTLGLETYNTGYNPTAQSFPGGWAAEEKWYHVAAVFGGGNVTYYVNGAQAGLTAAIDATPPPDAAFQGLFQIGAGSPTGDWGFPGKIDEVAIYNKALPPARIAAHYGAVAMTFNVHQHQFIDPSNLAPINVTLSAPAGQTASGLELTFAFDPAIIKVTTSLPPFGIVTIAPGTAYPIPDGVSNAVLTISPVAGSYGTTILTATPNAASGWLGGDSIQIKSSLTILEGTYVSDHFDDGVIGVNDNGVGGGFYQFHNGPAQSEDASAWFVGTSPYDWGSGGIYSKPAGEFEFMNDQGVRIEWVISDVTLTANGTTVFPGGADADCRHELGVISANRNNNENLQDHELFRNTSGGFYVNLYYAGSGYPTQNMTVTGNIRVVNAGHGNGCDGEYCGGLETPVTFQLLNVHKIVPSLPLVVTTELSQTGWKVGFSLNANPVYAIVADHPGVSVDERGKIVGTWDASSLQDAAITNEFASGGFLWALFQNVSSGRGFASIDRVKACVGCSLVTDCPDPFADADYDGDVDMDDFGAFQACFTGVGGGIPAGCGCFDYAVNGAIDLDDFSLFLNCATGAEVPVNKTCDDPL